MSTKEACVKQIDDAINSIIGVEAAYVARTRLRRLLLSCERMIAHRYSLPEPVLPGHFEAPAQASEDVQIIVKYCNRLAEQAHILSQPSEPLDDRWKSNWESAVRDLMFMKVMILRSDFPLR